MGPWAFQGDAQGLTGLGFPNSKTFPVPAHLHRNLRHAPWMPFSWFWVRCLGFQGMFLVCWPELNQDNPTVLEFPGNAKSRIFACVRKLAQDFLHSM